MIEVQVIASGRVQGVFFRNTINKIAKNFSINGYVKNLDNGSVEIVVQGEKNEIYSFLEAVKSNPEQARIDSFDPGERTIKQKYEGFKIDR